MSSTKEIMKRVDLRNLKTTDKNARIANAMEGIFDLVMDMEGHVKAMGILECIKDIENYTPSSLEMDELSNTMWLIALQSADSYEEAVGIITCVQLELQLGFIKANENGGRVVMDGFIKNQN